MAHKTTSSPDVRGASLWLRRGAPVAVLCVGVGVALAAGSRTPGAPAMTNANVAVETISTQSAVKAPGRSPEQEAQARAEGFGKSEVSDVMVRHVPAAATGAKVQTGAGRVFLPAGARRPVAPRNGYGTATTSGMTAVKLSNGRGVSRRIPRSMFPSSRVDNIDGRAVKHCVDPSHHHTTKTVHAAR